MVDRNSEVVFDRVDRNSEVVLEWLTVIVRSCLSG